MQKRILPGIVLLGIAALFLGCSQAPMTAPTAYKEWNAKDGTFRIDYPDDWEADGGGKHSIQWAKFEKGSAFIHVSVSFGESVVGDIVGSGMGVGGVGDFGQESDVLPPVAIIHESKRERMDQDYSNYREKETVEVQPPLGEGRKSEFKASKGLKDVHGYRVSILNNQRGITVICQCAEKDWETLQAAFDKIIETISFGTQ